MLRLIIVVTIGCVLVSALKTGLTRREKRALKKQHNMYRSQDASQADSKAASNLMKLRWNRNLAKRAQTTANKCIFGHSNSARSGIGENIFFTTGDVTKKGVGQAVDSWYKEKQNYHISTNTCDDGKVCGHYIQILWAPTSKVGCGLRQCAEVDVFGRKWKDATLVVCNYDKIVMRGQKPFILGPSCSKCPAKYQRCSKDTGNLCYPEDIIYSLMERDNSDEFGSEEESEEDLRRSLMTEDDEEFEEDLRRLLMAEDDDEEEEEEEEEEEVEMSL